MQPSLSKINIYRKPYSNFTSDELDKFKPDFVLILPWNIADEIKSLLSFRLPNCKFLTAVPELNIE